MFCKIVKFPADPKREADVLAVKKKVVPNSKKTSKQAKKQQAERELARAGDQQLKQWAALGEKALGTKKVDS